MAVAGGEIIGFAFALPPESPHFKAIYEQRAGFQMTKPEVWENTALGWLGKIAVRPDWMRRGVGKALYQRIFEDHRDWSFLTMSVVKPLSNTAAKRFHEQFGFVEVGEALLGDRGSLKNVSATVLYYSVC